MQSFFTHLAGVFLRILIFFLILSLVLHLPMAGQAIAQGADDGAAHVHARLNSPERAAAIAEAVRRDAAMKVDQASGTATADPVNTTFVGSANGGTAKVVSPAQIGSLSALAQASAPDASQRQSRTGNAPSYPRSFSAVMPQHAATMFGVPAPMGTEQSEDLGFHQDGTVRKAGGSAPGAGAGATDRRVVAYSQYGLSEGYNQGLIDPGYDSLSGYNWRISDPTAGSRIPGKNGMGSSPNQLGPTRAAMDRGLSYGLSVANSVGESALSSFVDGGRARLNFGIDWNGKISGESDVLLPFYDSQYTTIYTQLGARTMNAEGSYNSWIGNLGAGQRWFPGAQSLADSGDWMAGYNAFFDYDITRSHQRGGFGVEAQHDWLKLSSNYYFPLSGWRDAKGEDTRLKYSLERPAKGWDIRGWGYLPFYRHIAVTGAYSQWYGDEVGVFGFGQLEKNPRVWSYGLEYTPFPLLTAFVDQRQAERGRTDTQFGLRFTYTFNMSFEDSITPAKTRQQRTESLDRRDFVNRENKIILEYKEKDFSIALSGYHFTIASGEMLNIGIISYSASPINSMIWHGTAAAFAVGGDSTRWQFQMPVYNAAPGANNIYQAHITARNALGQIASSPTAIIELIPEVPPPVPVYALALSASPNSIANGGSTALTATLTNSGSPVSGQQINWSVVSGSGGGSLSVASSDTNGSGQATVNLTGTAAGTLTLRATLASDSSVIANVTITITPVYALTLSPDYILNIRLGSPIVLTATLTDNGQPVDGALINWNLTGLGLATITNQSRTNATGNATANFNPIALGIITIHATLSTNSGITKSVTTIIVGL